MMSAPPDAATVAAAEPLAADPGIAAIIALRRDADADADYWNRCRMPELIDYIINVHHAFTKSAIARTTLLANKVLARHGEQYPKLTRISALFAELASDLGPHMAREENVLFPYVRALADQGRSAGPASFCSVRNPVRVMMRQHDRALELLGELQAATDDFAVPEGACRAQTALYAALADLRADLLKHMALENDVFFPRAIALEDSL